MKLENNWRFKSLENLEKSIRPKIDLDSHLVERTSYLRKVPLNEFTVEDLRIMIGQSFSLDYLIPLALEKLKANVLEEGDLFPGDLLQAVVKVDPEFWKLNKPLKQELKQIINQNLTMIKVHKIKVEHFKL